MKQINNLIVLSVPKDAKEHQVRTEFGYSHLTYKHSGATYYSKPLPPGQYEIIGLYSEVIEDENKRVQALECGGSAGLIYTMLLDAGIDWQKLPDTTDLLFIKKLK